MKSLGNVLAALAAVTVIGPMTASAQDGHRKVLPALNEYFELIASENFDIAGDMWTPEALERSGRFGIAYSNIPLRVDCNSPIIRNFGDVQSSLMSPIRKYETLEENAWYKLEYSTVLGNALLNHNYFVQQRGDWFWLSYPQDFYASEWPVVESRYFRVHAHPEARRFLNDVVLAEADSFVEQTAKRLGIDGDTRELIARDKIEYYYCASDTVVEQITGFLVKSTLDLASNDVISADFPHFHELTHLLVNIRLKELPLYSLPITREGIAVYLGGRWGKHPAALMDLAIFLYQEELVEFDSILTMTGFQTASGADIVYPVTGMFCGYLVDRLGMSDFLELYRQLSGDFKYLNRLSTTDIQGILVEALGRDDWAELMSDFDAYVADYLADQAVALAGAGEADRVILETDRVAVGENGDWISFEFTGLPDDTLCQGNLLFDKLDRLEGQLSSLYDSQYGAEVAYEGFRYGVRYDQNEIGLYDYATNLLVAKYIWGITPSDDYYDAEAKTISIRFRKSVFEGGLPEPGQFKLLPF